MAVPEKSGPLTARSTRLLVEMWWETRDRRWGRRVLRGHVTELPDGRRQAFSAPRGLTALLMAAASRLRRGDQDERSA